MNYGLAYVDGGWTKTANGRIRRATSIVDKAARLLAPLWGAVWSEPERGNAPWPRGVDALDVIIEDRIRFLWAPMMRRGEMKDLTIVVGDDPNNAKRRRALCRFTDGENRVHELPVFVRVAG